MSETNELDEQGARELIVQALDQALDAAGIDKIHHRAKVRALAAEQMAVARIGEQNLIVVPSKRDGFPRYTADARRMEAVDLVREVIANDPLLSAAYPEAESNFDAHPEPIVLTREQARNTRTYERAKAQAQREGRELQIRASDPQPPKLTGKSGSVVDGKLLITRELARDTERYRAFRDRAEREGLDLHIID